MLHHERPSGPSRPPVNHDKADMYRRPAAWRDMKKLYGQQHHLDRLFAGMERLYACADVRLFLANALHHWLNMTPGGREKAYHDFMVYRAEQSAVYMAEHGHFKELEQLAAWRDEYRLLHRLDEQEDGRVHDLDEEDRDD